MYLNLWMCFVLLLTFWTHFSTHCQKARKKARPVAAVVIFPTFSLFAYPIKTPLPLLPTLPLPHKTHSPSFASLCLFTQQGEEERGRGWMWVEGRRRRRRRILMRIDERKESLLPTFPPSLSTLLLSPLQTIHPSCFLPAGVRQPTKNSLPKCCSKKLESFLSTQDTCFFYLLNELEVVLLTHSVHSPLLSPSPSTYIQCTSTT